MMSLECLFLDVDSLDPVLIWVHLCIHFLLESHLRVSPSEIGGTPHLVCVELVWASVLVAVAHGLIVHAVEKGVACLETELAVEVVAMRVTHEEEAVITQVHIAFFIFNYTSIDCAVRECESFVVILYYILST